MTNINDFATLRRLDDKVLAEMVREGEARLAAQLTVATAADQRAMTFAGFLITISVAALAGAGAVIASEKVTGLVVWAGAYAIIMAIGAVIALSAASPELYHLPGNLPRGWLPERWHVGVAGPHDLTQARVEQAFALDVCIRENMAAAQVRARRFALAVRWACGWSGIGAIIATGAGIALLLTR